ncbi:MAG: hypothetical protein OXC62_02385 [Aestuariivita sp.]|nr:hypothetical protein [Aestuariivita sp.]
MTKIPLTCPDVKLKNATSWKAIADLKRKPGTSTVLTFDGKVLTWGGRQDIEDTFDVDFLDKSEMTFDPHWRTGLRLYVKNFFEE